MDTEQLAVRREYMIAMASLERLLINANEDIQRYSAFLDIFKNRYPNCYEDIVKEFNAK